MPEQSTMLKRAIFPLIAVIPLVAFTLWVLTDEPQAAAPSTSKFDQTQNAPKSVKAVPAIESGTSSGPAIQATESQGEVAYQTPESLGETPFASSLAGTDIDGSLKTDPDGNLILDLSTKDFFDYFLNTVGEVSPETAMAQIESLARDNLPAAAADQALAVLGQYLDYKQQSVALGNRAMDPALQRDPAYQLQMLKTALTDLKQIRRNAFDPETHEAFFGLQEAYGEYTLASIEINQRADLSAQSKKTLLEYHRNQLPEQLRRTETRMISDAETGRQRQAAIDEASSPDEAGERLRDLGVDPEQAEEVVSYLREREQFDTRFQQYQKALTSLEKAGISEGDFQSQKSELLKQHFDNEQARTWAKLKSLEATSPN